MGFDEVHRVRIGPLPVAYREAGEGDAKGIAVNAREGCLHVGVHFYSIVAEIDRLLAVLDESV